MKRNKKNSFFQFFGTEMLKRKKVFILQIILVFFLASVAFTQGEVERYRLGNYIEGITFISDGQFAGKFAFAEGWYVYIFDIHTGTYEKLFNQADLSLAIPTRGICYISQGDFAGNFLMNGPPDNNTQIIVSPSGTLVSEVTFVNLPQDFRQTEGMTQITSGPYQGNFAMIGFTTSGYIPHICIFSIEDMSGTLNAYIEKDISNADLGVYPLGIGFLPEDYPDPAYRNHFVLSDLEFEPGSDPPARYFRVMDDQGVLKAKFPVDRPYEGLAYINKGPYSGMLMVHGEPTDTCMRNLDGTEKIQCDLGVGIGISLHLFSLAWLENTNQFLIGRWMIDSYFYFASRIGPDNWILDTEKEYSDIPRWRDITELIHEEYYYLFGYRNVYEDGSWKRLYEVHKLNSDFNFVVEYPIPNEYSGKDFGCICYIPGSTTGDDQFALSVSSEKRIYLFDENFSYAAEIVDLTDKVNSIWDIYYDAASQRYYLLDQGRVIRVFDSDWAQIAECDVSNLEPGIFRCFTKIKTGDLQGNFALLSYYDTEIVIINLEVQIVISQMENLIEEILTSSIQQSQVVKISTIQKGIKNSLVKKLENAISSLEKGNINAAINKMEAFQNEVRAQNGKKIPVELAECWINKAEEIIQALMDL